MSRLVSDLQEAGFKLIETHISWVFIGEDEVFKVKRPVDYGFLDFSTLAKRRAACEAELKLNQRLAPAVYLGVVPIGLDDRGRHRLNAGGEPVDWAVHMRRLPDEARADLLLQSGHLTGARIDALAAHMAEFHQRARCDEETERHGSVAVIRANVEENFAQTEDCIEQYLSPAQAEEIRQWQLKTLEREELFEARIRAGRVRDGHGDLRLEHVYFLADESIAVIDCIEFNERFRYGDVCADIAFLSMDLTWHGRADLAERFLAQYARHANDYDLYSVVNFYESYRAFVRGKISAVVEKDPSMPTTVRERAHRDARRYFLLSLAFERPPASAPALIAVGGMIASGKSSVARRGAELLSAPVLSSDRTRKHLMGKAATESIANEAWAGAYSAETTQATYDELWRQAGLILASGRPVIIDASFRSRSMRARARDLARSHGAAFLMLECVASKAVLLERLLARETAGPQESDARSELLEEFDKKFEPVSELPETEFVRIDSTGTEAETSRALRSALDRFSPQRPSPAPGD